MSGTDSQPSRVAVVSASMGGGHDAVADELVRRLRARGCAAHRYDMLELFPAGVGRGIQWAYARQLEYTPGGWGMLCGLLAWAPMVALVGWLCAVLCGRAMREAVGDASAVISTYPLATQVLGRLRARGRLDAPVVTYLTDISVHPLWVARGGDGYLAPHSVTAGQAAARGATQVRLVEPAVREVFRQPGTGDRSRWGLPAGRLALVCSGAWGAGDVARIARDIADTGLATPVVVCATNTALRTRLTADGIGIALGWVDDMAGLMRSCDMVVTNGGGVTTVEAMALGVPVLVYRELPGHGLTNAMAYDSAGLATWVRDRRELPGALSDPLPPAPGESIVDSAVLVLAMLDAAVGVA